MTHLIKVGLQVVDLLAVLEETRPVLLLELLLAIDLAVEVNVDGICDLLGR
jgi:hypothetical protein